MGINYEKVIRYFELLIFLGISIFILKNYCYFLTIDNTYVEINVISKFVFNSPNFILYFLSLYLGRFFSSIIYFVSSTISFYFISNVTSFKYTYVFIFLLNPFFYSRLMVGQWGVLISYFFLPVTYYYIKRFIVLKNDLSLLKLVLVVSVSSTFSIHFFLINLLVFTFTFFFNNLNYLCKIDLKLNFKLIIMGFTLLVLLNSFWIQDFFNNQNTILQDIDSSHEDFFQPKLTQGVPTVAKVIGMWGFWRENGYITTYSTLPLPLWYFITLLFPLLMMLGYHKHKDRVEAKTMLSLWWIGVIFATGASHPYTRPIFDFCFNYIPFFNGFRDSHKFVALIVLAYAFLIPSGLQLVTEFIQKRFKK